MISLRFSSVFSRVSVERITREVRIGAVGGGSEEVMLDLGMRQAKLWALRRGGEMCVEELV